MAILPLRLMLVKSLKLLRRILPDAVANTTFNAPQLDSSSGIGITVLMVSSGSIGKILTMALPSDCGAASGSL